MVTHSPRDRQERITVRALTDIADRFNHERVRYLIVGGLAVVAHGYVHATVAMDLVIAFGDGNERRAVAALKTLGYQPRIPEPIESYADPTKREGWARDQDMRVFTVQKEESEVDLFLHIPFDFDQAYAQAMWTTAKDDARIRVPFIDLGRLLAMKRAAGRAKDRVDIENLLAVAEEALGGEGEVTLGRHEREQRRSEAAWPFWKKLQWLEEMTEFAIHLRDAPRVPPPEWVQDLLRVQQTAILSPQCAPQHQKAMPVLRS
jgi:hypothetical protein